MGKEAGSGEQVLRERLRTFERWGKKLPEKQGVRRVHQTRVALRRLRAALSLFELEAEVSALKALMQSLGRLRDAQLRLQWLSARNSPELEPLRVQLQKALPGLGKAVVGDWSRWRRLEREGLRKSIKSLEPVDLLGTLDERAAKLRKARKRWLGSREAKDAHRLRIALKKLRYELELFEPEPVVEKLLGKMRPLQEVLGELHDADVRLEWLKALEEPAIAQLLEEEMARRARLELEGLELTRALRVRRSLEKFRRARPRRLEELSSRG